MKGVVVRESPIQQNADKQKRSQEEKEEPSLTLLLFTRLIITCSRRLCRGMLFKDHLRTQMENEDEG